MHREAPCQADSLLHKLWSTPHKSCLKVLPYHHYKYQGDLLIPNHYIYCNDETLATFRVTLYDNLTQTKTNCCTVEVLWDELYDSEVIFNELKTMGVFSANTRRIDFEKIYLKNGFPIPYKEDKKEQYNIGKDIIVLNKDAQNFFMEDLLRKMYYILKKEIITKVLN